MARLTEALRPIAEDDPVLDGRRREEIQHLAQIPGVVHDAVAVEANAADPHLVGVVTR
jgi:hypothetical protein